MPETSPLKANKFIRKRNPRNQNRSIKDYEISYQQDE